MLNKTLTKTRKIVWGNFHKEFKQNACFDEFVVYFNNQLNRRNMLREHSLRRLLFFFRNTAIRLVNVFKIASNLIHSKDKSLLGLKQKLIRADSFGVHRTPMKLHDLPLYCSIVYWSYQNNTPKRFGYMFCFEQTSILLDRWGLSSFIGVR